MSRRFDGSYRDGEAWAMKTLEILGPGCDRCEALAANAEAAAEELGIEFELIRVTDVYEIMQFEVMMTPALVVDGEVKIVGRVAPIEEIKPLLT